MGVDTTEATKSTSGESAFPARAEEDVEAPSTSGEAPSISGEEEDWVAKIRKGDEAAFEALFRRYYPELCSFAVGFVGSFDEAREVVQTVLMKIWERRARWKIDSTLKGYLYQAVRNQGLNYSRREKRRRSVSLDEHADVLEPAAQSNPEGITSLRERLRQVQDAIDRLPERQRTAFILHRRHGLSYKEIADVMDISPRTVEIHISSALKALRKTDGR